MEKADFSQEKNPLTDFSPQQQTEIKYKQQILSSLAYFIGKDFQIPVELNEPGAGWNWDFKENIIKIDPKDLLERPMGELRFIISHEASHKRISRADFIPSKEWNQPGFSAMMNAIEDPRSNNFVVESYPKLIEEMNLYYLHDLDLKKAEDIIDQPRFIQASYEYIRQWFNEVQGKPMEISANLPEDVKKVVTETLALAQDSWQRYPTKAMADGKEFEKLPNGENITGEQLVREFSKLSYEINRDKIWPEFKKLIKQDITDQQIQSLLASLIDQNGQDDVQKDEDQQDSQSGNNQNDQDNGQDDDQKDEDQQDSQSENETEQILPKELKDKLTPKEREILQEVIKKALENNSKKQNQPSDSEENSSSESENDSSTQQIDTSSLPNSLKQKIKKYIDSLPKQQQEKINQQAQNIIKEFEDALNEELRGKLLENPQDLLNKEFEEPKNPEQEPTSKREDLPKIDHQEMEKFKEKLNEILKFDANAYETMRREVIPIIDKLENELRELFIIRKNSGWKSGFITGKRIDIKQRIQEKAKLVSAMESIAWERRKQPQEKDYAFSLLVDLSNSMTTNNKITETFKSVIVLSEVLNRLSIKLETLGFNSKMFEYQKFNQPISTLLRENMSGMLQEVENTWSGNTDIGWAMDETSIRLTKQKVDQKFLIVLSDGEPNETQEHQTNKYQLENVIKNITEKTNIKLIGLGIGRGTDYVTQYFPKSIANVNVKEMSEKLANLVKELIYNYDKY